MPFWEAVIPIPRTFLKFRNKLVLYGEELLGPRPTFNLEDHLLLVVRDCLLNTLATTIHTWRQSSPSASRRRAVLW